MVIYIESPLFQYFFCLVLINISLPLFRCQIEPSTAHIGGEWRLLQQSVGISAMHMQLLHNNKIVMFDRTDFGRSNLSLPKGKCRYDSNDTALKTDCTAHSLVYDIGSNSFRPLMVQTDTFCSSGAVVSNGTFVQIGGYNDGDRTIRTLDPCVTDDCDWVEHSGYLNGRRWYASNQVLPDGRVIVVGGRRQFNYEFYPKSSMKTYWLNFLKETNDDCENNLYPFLHLLPDGNLFIFANTRSISFDYKHDRIVKEFPRIPGGDPRNYPSSGSSVLLPIRFSTESSRDILAEVLICGGATRDGFSNAQHGNFIQASTTCARLRVSEPNPDWEMEQMPMPRVMGDMLILPTADIIIINGARTGTAGWENGREPVTAPVIYRPYEHVHQRFLVMNKASIPRLYHSSAVLVPDGRILIGGSNPHTNYVFNGQYPTELSLDAFSPPYLAREYDQIRPRIISCPEIISYGRKTSLTFTVSDYRSANDVRVSIISPSFTTHSFAMNQRLVMLRVREVRHVAPSTYEVSVLEPPVPEVAPSGYYMMFVVHGRTPSSGMWVKLQ